MNKQTRKTMWLVWGGLLLLVTILLVGLLVQIRSHARETLPVMVLTGTKPEIRKLGIDSLKLTAIEKKPEEREDSNDLFIHSTIFVLVDRKSQLRGVFETTGEGIEPTEVQEKILRNVSLLEREK
jgi:cytochrome oxidase Cu insertion factor (SCO1/SenC/PrrC family)